MFPTPTTPAEPPLPIQEPPAAAPGLDGKGDLADGRARRLDPRIVACERIGGGLFLAVLALAASLGWGFLLLGDEMRLGRLLLLGALALLVLGLLAGVTFVHPRLKLATSSWTLTAERFEIQSGVWFQHLRSVPRARVQHTDVERGPIERRFGLATLVVHTAGHQDSEIRLEGLAHETAVAIRDHLLAGGERSGGS